MTQIYLIRHAEAEGNLYRRAQGQYDSNVTALGRRQIAALAQRFREVKLDALWSSDLIRTQSTASAIQKYHPALPLRLSPELREIGIGVWEDTPWGNLDRDDPEQMTLFARDPERFHVTGSERFSDVVTRMRRKLLAIAAENDGGTVAVLSHGMAIRALLCDILGVPSERVHEIPHGDNTAVSLLTAENGALGIEFYNDAGHLSDETSTFARQLWWRKADGGHDDNDNVRFEPLVLPRDAALYSRCYADTWRASHGSLAGYTPALYVRSAENHSRSDPATLVQMLHGGDFAGLVELDPDRGAREGAGWISLIFVEPAFRQRRLGIQLLGHAVSLFRARGRDCLRLHVSATNETAIGFYEYNGFRPVAEVEGVGGPLYQMEMDIRRRVWTLP